MRKYYFAYHLVNGNPFAFMWIEEEGMPVGGRPNPEPDTTVEITQQEFELGELKPLELEHPYKGLPPPSPD